MSERWREPVVPLAIEPVEEGLWTPDGRQQRGVALTLRGSDVERMRLGYVCAKCLEPFERPWPERCPVCGVAVRRDQAAFFAREFDPVPLSLAGTDWDAEMAGIEERLRKEEEAK